MRRIAFVAPPIVVLASLISWGQQPKTEESPKVDEKPTTKLFDVNPPEPVAGDTELQKLQKQRYAVAWKELNLRDKFFRAGVITEERIEALFANLIRLNSSFLATEPSQAAKLEFLTNYLDFTRYLEFFFKKRFEQHNVHEMDLHRTTFFRLDAEIQLLKAKAAK